MEITEIPIEFNGGIMPTKGSEYAAAFDVYCPCDYELKQQRQVVKLGFCIELPIDWKAYIRARSGFSARGMDVEVRTTYRRYNGEEYVSTERMNIDADVLTGLVDSDYRNEVGVTIKAYFLEYIAPQKHEFDTIVENHIFLTKGTRFAQMEICGGRCVLKTVERINRDIDRGGGYGHTGNR